MYMSRAGKGEKGWQRGDRIQQERREKREESGRRENRK